MSSYERFLGVILDMMAESLARVIRWRSRKCGEVEQLGTSVLKLDLYSRAGSMWRK